MPAREIEMSAHVPLEDYKEFKARFPQYGATKWFITTALRLFNEQARRHPDAHSQIAEAITQAVNLERTANAAVIAVSQSEEGES